MHGYVWAVHWVHVEVSARCSLDCVSHGKVRLR